jgi:DNA gyrase inhibitor GyrI
MTIVERPDTPVLYLRCDDRVEEIQATWPRLEAAVGSLRGRRFFGVMHAGPQPEYWACVARRDGDDAAALGLRTGVIPGGRYARRRLTGEPPEVFERIVPGFRALEREHREDGSRPSIEDYRRYDRIDLLLPVTDDV